MKKILLVLAVIMAFAVGGVSSASAGTCSAAFSPTISSGVLRVFTGALYCTTYPAADRIDKVQFDHSGASYPAGDNGFWYDQSPPFYGTWFYSALQPGLNVHEVTVSSNGSALSNFGRNSWCGGATHSGIYSFSFRIHQFVGNTWGPWHQVQTAPTTFVC